MNISKDQLIRLHEILQSVLIRDNMVCTKYYKVCLLEKYGIQY